MLDISTVHPLSDIIKKGKCVCGNEKFTAPSDTWDIIEIHKKKLKITGKTESGYTNKIQCTKCGREYNIDYADWE